MIATSRRSFITGLISLVAAPAIVRAGSLMPVKADHCLSLLDTVYNNAWLRQHIIPPPRFNMPSGKVYGRSPMMDELCFLEEANRINSKLLSSMQRLPEYLPPEQQ